METHRRKREVGGPGLNRGRVSAAAAAAAPWMLSWACLNAGRSAFSLERENTYPTFLVVFFFSFSPDFRSRPRGDEDCCKPATGLWGPPLVVSRCYITSSSCLTKTLLLFSRIVLSHSPCDLPRLGPPSQRPCRASIPASTSTASIPSSTRASPSPPRTRPHPPRRPPRTTLTDPPHPRPPRPFVLRSSLPTIQSSPAILIPALRPRPPLTHPSYHLRFHSNKHIRPTLCHILTLHLTMTALRVQSRPRRHCRTTQSRRLTGMPTAAAFTAFIADTAPSKVSPRSD